MFPDYLSVSYDYEPTDPQSKLEFHKKVCENKDSCGDVMPSKNIKIQEFHQYQKPDKVPFTTYADLESLIKRRDECKNNSEKLSTTKVGEDILFGYSMFTIWNSVFQSDI